MGRLTAAVRATGDRILDVLVPRATGRATTCWTEYRQITQCYFEWRECCREKWESWPTCSRWYGDYGC